MMYKALPKILRPIRVPFNSWGGKRDGEYAEYPFTGDDGKETNDGKAAVGVKRTQGSVMGNKVKTPFNSWGGKRGDQLLANSLAYDSFIGYDLEKPLEEQKFDSYGGKRFA